MITFIKKIQILCMALFVWSCGGNTTDKATEETQINREVQVNNKVEDEKISIISETYEHKSDDGNISAKIEYPQIEGMKNKDLQLEINQLLKKTLDIDKAIPEDIESYFEGMPQEMKGYSKEGNFTTGITNSDLISFSAYQSEFMAGAAHPTDFIKGYNINPKTGKFYTIQDFIIPTQMEAFNTLLLEEIENGECKDDFEGMYEETMCKFNPDMHSFHFTEEGMEVYLEGCFPHVARLCNDISIPYQKLKKLSIKDSPIAGFMN